MCCTETCSEGICYEMSELHIKYSIYGHVYIYVAVSENGVYTKSIAN